MGQATGGPMTGDEQKTEDTVEEPRRKRRRRGWIFWPTVLVVLLLLIAPIALVAISGRPIAAPDWVRTRVELVANQSLAGGSVELGNIEVLLTENWEPHVRIASAALSDQTGLPIADLEAIEVTLSRSALMQGQVLPIAVDVDGAALSLRRDPEGRFDLSLQSQESGGRPTGSFADVLDSVDALFTTPALASIQSVRAEGVTFQYEDVRAERFWVATGGALELDQTADELDLRLGFQLLYGEDRPPAQAALSFRSVKGSPRATFAANVRALPASDFSTQAPAFAFLSVLNAPVSGAIRAEIGEDGVLSSMDGTLDIAQGALQPTDVARPISFNSGRAYFSFDPKLQKISFDEVSVSTGEAQARAEGHAYLQDIADGWPQALIGQFRFREIAANPEDLYEAPVEFEEGALDFRLRLDPFTLDIGQAMLVGKGTQLRADGQIRVAEEGWQLGLKFGVDEIHPDRLIALWPQNLVPNTRQWLDENVLDGAIRNVTAVIRLAPEADPRTHLSFNFADATVRFLKSLPPITNGAGFASISEDSFTLTAEKGEVAAPEGGVLDATGTVLKIADVAQNPPDMTVSLRANGPIPAATSLLDLRPFEFFSKAGLPTHVAAGLADVSAEITLPLIKDVLVSDVAFEVVARLTNVTSDTLIENRNLRAGELTLLADNDQIEIGGDGFVGVVPFRGRWVQALGPDEGGSSRVEGTIELSQRFVDEFRIGLPDGAVRGEGRGAFELVLRRDEPAEFSLTSDLNRVGLRIPEIGWSKPEGSTGELLVRGAMADPLRVDEIVLSGSGLTANGTVTLNPEGLFARADFSRVRIGSWFDGAAALISRGEGRAPAVQVVNGRMDIRETTFGQGGTAGGGRNTPITLALDRVVVSNGIAIHGFRGELSTSPGLNGTFTGRVNGQAPIRGTLVPQPNGIAVRILSQDAGAVMRSAGVFDKVFDGSMELILVPRAEDGQYNGQLTAENVRVRGANALADLLSAISVIGLLEQLNGQGILFGNVSANFRLTPWQVIVTQSSAVGASLGVSMDGIYELGSERLDMQGVISPIYVVNGIGAILTRRGEGLFGFNYRIRGTAEDPQVSVNPLSILTPGMFRDIFRRPPPQPQE